MKRLKKFSFLVLIAGLSLSASTATAQIASSGTYTLEQAVVAGGGGKSNSPNFSIEGTLGQSIAGSSSSSANFGVRAGFWQAFFAPTAALVSVSGRVITPDGSPVFRARVTLTDGTGATRSTLSSNFGYYRFDDIEVGQTYILSATAKQFQFAPRVIAVNDELSNLDLIGLQ